MQTVAENSDIRSLWANKVQWRVICGFHAVGQQHSENANLSLEGINDPECCFFFFFSQFILYLRISCLLWISSYYTSSYCSLREAELHKEKQQSSGICCIQKKKKSLFITTAQMVLTVLFFLTAVTMQLYPISFLTLFPSESAYLSAHNLNRCVPSMEESRTSYFA